MAGKAKIICGGCGDLFVPARKRSKCCSKACQYKASRGRPLSIETRQKMSETRLSKIVIPFSKVACLYILCRMTVAEVAKIINVDPMTLYARMNRVGIKTRTCEEAIKKGEERHNWRGGKFISDGYVRFSYGKYRDQTEHRVIAEKVLGRKLTSNEVVHHINDNRSDNRNSNPLICTRSYHTWLHRTIDIKNNKPLFGRKK